MKYIKHSVLSSLFTLLVAFAMVGGIGPRCGWAFYQPKVPTSLLK